MVWVQILILCFGEHGRDQAFHARRRIGARQRELGIHE